MGVDNTAPVRAEHDDVCPTVAYVYPYWSVCDWPLRYFEAFHLTSGTLGGLETQQESTSGRLANVVSLTGSSEELGATFFAAPVEPTPLVGVPANDSVMLINSKTLRPLTWTFRAWFRSVVLTEEPLSSDREPATFRFVQADQPLACPRIANARCESYFLLSDSAPYGVAAFNMSDAGPTVLLPALEGSDQSLIFLAIRPRNTTGSTDALM